MPAVPRIDPKTVFSAEEWRRLTARSSLRGMLLVAHAWGTITAAVTLVALWPNPLTWLLAVMVVGTRQLGLAILMHEAAHGGLHANKAINEWIGQWLCAVPVGADLASYRSYHLQHHKFTQQPEDPDLSLSAPFPITKESFGRKAIRDLTGQTFVKQRLPLFLSLFKRGNGEEEPSHESFVSSGADKMARFLLLNALLFGCSGWLAPASGISAYGCRQWRPGYHWSRACATLPSTPAPAPGPIHSARPAPRSPTRSSAPSSRPIG
jgi:fatty acid desaturase